MIKKDALTLLKGHNENLNNMINVIARRWGEGTEEKRQYAPAWIHTVLTLCPPETRRRGSPRHRPRPVRRRRATVADGSGDFVACGASCHRPRRRRRSRRNRRRISPPAAAARRRRPAVGPPAWPPGAAWRLATPRRHAWRRRWPPTTTSGYRW